MKKGWTVQVLPEEEIHNTVDFEACKCKPRINDEGIIVHNAYDGRQNLEKN